jgi:CDP-glycerol glycerophosphotransferase
VKLSIIVPFHKGIHFLEDCLESIRDQGLTNFETILVLDHVQEDVSELINAYRDLNLNVIELSETHLTNRKFGKQKAEDQFKNYSGVASAGNKGLEAATGEYVYFLDSDDYILNGTLQLLLKEAEEQLADFTYGKKTSTWFSRKVYLASIAEAEQEEEADDQDPNDQEQTEQEMSDQVPETTQRMILL